MKTPKSKTPYYALRGLLVILRWLSVRTGWILAWIFAPFVLALYVLRRLGGKYGRHGLDNEDFPCRFAEVVGDYAEIAVPAVFILSTAWMTIATIWLCG